MKIIYKDGTVAECPQDQELHVLRHTAAHIMAQAIKRLYPQADFAFGPATENGFYYDVDLGDTKLTDDDLAKQHVRHMIGGRSARADDELLYRFEFPERPGALMRFLSAMSPNWNISLFHYRNQGGDVGRILVGLQVPQAEMDEFRQFLASLGYRYWDESGNPVYKLFLGA